MCVSLSVTLCSLCLIVFLLPLTKVQRPNFLDFQTFAHKRCKIAAQEKFCFSANLPYQLDFFGIGATIRIHREVLCLPFAGFFKIVLWLILIFYCLFSYLAGWLKTLDDGWAQLGHVLYCNVKHCTVLYCTVLHCTVRHCTVLYYTELFCTVLYCTIRYSTVLYCTVLYCTVVYSTIQYCTVLYCTIRYCTGSHLTATTCSKARDEELGDNRE